MIVSHVRCCCCCCCLYWSPAPRPLMADLRFTETRNMSSSWATTRSVPPSVCFSKTASGDACHSGVGVDTTPVPLEYSTTEARESTLPCKTMSKTVLSQNGVDLLRAVVDGVEGFREIQGARAGVAERIADSTDGPERELRERRDECRDATCGEGGREGGRVGAWGEGGQRGRVGSCWLRNNARSDSISRAVPLEPESHPGPNCPSRVYILISSSRHGADDRWSSRIGGKVPTNELPN